MAWFFRAIEQPDGSWVCRRGLVDYDSHATLHESIDHLRLLAEGGQPAELFAHRLDGVIEKWGR